MVNYIVSEVRRDNSYVRIHPEGIPLVGLLIEWNPNIYPYGFPDIGARLTLDECEERSTSMIERAEWEKFYTGITGEQLPTCSHESTRMNCQHDWITTQGFTSIYEDCKNCGIKKEDSYV